MRRRHTVHGKKRVAERISSNFKSTTLINNASKYGRSINAYCGAFYHYLSRKDRDNIRIKVYKDYIYIFTKNSKKLITAYPVPVVYLPLEQFEIPVNILNLINRLKMYRKLPVIIELRNGDIKKGYVNKVITDYVVINNNSKGKINIEDIKDVKVDEVEFIKVNEIQFK